MSICQRSYNQSNLEFVNGFIRFNFFLKIYLHCKCLFPNSKSTNSQVLFYIIDSISLLIVSFHYCVSGVNIASYLQNRILPYNLENQDHKKLMLCPFTVLWFYIFYSTICSLINSLIWTYIYLVFTWKYIFEKNQAFLNSSIVSSCMS